MFAVVTWYYERNGGQQGPESTEQIQQRLQQGELSGATLVWRDGMNEWTPLSQVAELSGEASLPGGVIATGNVATGTQVYAPPQVMQGSPGVGMPPVQNGMALTSMILGICSCVLTLGCGIGFVLAIPAVILGHIGRKQIKNGNQMQTGDGMALTGLITGYIIIGLSVVMGVFVAIMIINESSSSPTTFP